MATPALSVAAAEAAAGDARGGTAPAPNAVVALPEESHLRAFAAAAALLLVERRPRAGGQRTVSRRIGSGTQVFDWRDYTPGDPVRDIDWRTTARQRRPIVRRFEAETAHDWTLLLDASSSMAVGDCAKWHAAVQVVAAMAYTLLQLDHRVELIAFADRVVARCPRGRGRRHYAAVAHLLARLRPPPRGAGSTMGVCARHLHGASTAFAISDFLAADEFRRDLAAIAARCSAVHAFQVHDAAETRIAAAGDVELVDVETGQRRPARLDAAAAAFAARQREAMTARLRAFCARQHMAFGELDVGRPWPPALLAHLERAGASC